MVVSDTRGSLLSAAEQLVRTRGYSGISYADLATAVGIRKASIHHHFPGKADLGIALVEQYIERFEGALADIEQTEPTALGRIRRYAKLYEASVRQGMLCLCGMLVTEVNNLPEAVQTTVATYFAQQLKWLQRVVSAGQKSGELSTRMSARRTAAHVLSTLQGSSLVAWGVGDPSTVKRSSDDLVLLLAA